MQVYSDPNRESEAHALPDVEVFYYDAQHQVGDCWEVNEPGWYYWFCFPGCLPDSEPVGPYATAQDAVRAARERE